MKKPLMVLFLLCIGATSVPHALAQGKSGKSGPQVGFLSVPMGPNFIVPGKGVGAMSTVSVPSLPGMSGLSMGGGVPSSSAGGVAGGNMPAVSAVANGLPLQANGIGQPGGKQAMGVPTGQGNGASKGPKALATPASESSTQSASAEELRAEGSQQASQVIAQVGSRPLPTCR